MTEETIQNLLGTSQTKQTGGSARSQVWSCSHTLPIFLSLSPPIIHIINQHLHSPQMPGVSGGGKDIRFEIDVLGGQGARKGRPPFRLGGDVSLGLETRFRQDKLVITGL